MADLLGREAANLATILGCTVQIRGDGPAAPDARRVEALFAAGRAAEVSIDLDDAARCIGERVTYLAQRLAKGSPSQAIGLLLEVAGACRRRIE